MAKGSGNPAGKRPSSRNAQPYDASNSFVKRVANKAKDFIPQSSWISGFGKWFNTSQGNEDTLESRENIEETELEDDVQQPPSKRSCIRMNVVHPPGTFSIQSRVKNTLNTVDSSKEQYPVHNEVTEDFMEPAIAGPSGIGRLISSTPAVQTDIRTVTSHRSDLNSLTSSTNNGIANGMDDNSELSESTSGCSSLIPQINRHEGPSNLLYSSFSNRKRHIDDKLTYTDHLQTSRSLLLDINSRDTLSSRRPSFNASVVANALDRASPLSSPFYSGNTTFGGANAAGLYKRGRNLFNNSSELQLKVPGRTNVEVKSPNSTVDSSGMSQTAKKILEALEHFSSPITDAKKIPLKNTNNIVSSTVSRKRTRAQVLEDGLERTNPSARIGLRHLTRELTVPTVPDILKLKRRQKLQDTTLAARKIVSARSDPPPSPQEYRLRTEDNDGEKYRGKLKGKSKINLEQEETVALVNLPNIPLPITTLPNFNFTLPPPASHVAGKTTANKENTFTFASPIKVTDSGKNLQPVNNFTFSNPINAEDNIIMIDSNSPSKTENTESTAPAAMFMPNFIWSGSSTAPRLKAKIKNSKDDFVGSEETSKLKSGSVMDILCPKSDKMESNLIEQSDLGLVSEKSSTDKIASTFSSDIKSTHKSFWVCSECLIRNSNADEQCTACKIVRSNPNDKTSSSSTPETVAKSKSVANDCFGSQFKLSKDQWECTTCCVRNKQSDVKCVACSTPKHQLRTEDSDSEKYHGKLKGKSKVNLEQEETVTLVNLPNIPLPITTLPNFNFTLPPPASHTAGKTMANKENTFSFGSPIKMTDSGKNLQSVNNVTFNNPINTEDNVNDTIDSPSKTQNTESTAPAATMFMPNFIWSGSSTAPRLKAKVKNSKDDFVESEEASKLKSGSVMDILDPKSNKMDSNFVDQSNSASEKSSTDKIANTFSSDIKSTHDVESSWECSECLIRNSNADEQCTACKIVRSNPNDKISSPSTSTTETVVKSKPVANDCFGSQFKLSKDQWECTTCCVRNKQSDAKCVACSTPKPGSSSATPQNIKFQNSDLMEKFKPAEGSWECSGCLLRNAANILTCPCCNASKPTSLKTNPKKTDFATESSAQKLSTAGTKDTTMQETMPPFIFGMPKQETKLPGFSSSAQAPAVNPIPSFGAPSNSATPLFGSSGTTPAFGNTTTPAFGDTATTPAIFTFGSTSSQQPSSGGFNFSADTNPPASSAKPQTIKFQNSDLMEKFKPAEGSWECSGCLLRNAADVLTCPCCDTSKPTSLKTNLKKTDFATESSAQKLNTTGTKDTTMQGTMPPLIFGSSKQETKLPEFNSSAQTPAVNPIPTFGAPSNTATPSLFGSSSTTPAFGNTTTPVFGDTATTPTMFTFGSTSSQQPSSGGFNFSANTNPPASSAKPPFFTFGSNSSTPPSNNNMFGSFGANTAPTNAPNFAFNPPKQEAPTAFGQDATTTPIFGTSQTNPQTQATSSFSSTASSSTGFNFGSTAPPAATSGGFNFGGMSSTSTPTGGFNFNPPTTAPTVAFDPNSRPSFNFTKGNVPTTFNAPPQSAAAAGSRKIKKAFRRCMR